MEDYLDNVLVDMNKKQFKLFSMLGDEKLIPCDTTDQFMSVLSFIRNTVDEDSIYYVDSFAKA